MFCSRDHICCRDVFPPFFSLSYESFYFITPFCTVLCYEKKTAYKMAFETPEEQNRIN